MSENKRPICYVSMPFGKKTGPDGTIINFDSIYTNGIKLALQAVGITPIRADSIVTPGTIFKEIIKQIIHCDIMIADLTLENPLDLHGAGHEVLRDLFSISVPIVQNGGIQILILGFQMLFNLANVIEKQITCDLCIAH